MDNLKQFTLPQLHELIAQEDSERYRNYITRNLVVARNVNPSVFVSKFENQTIVLPEMRLFIIKHGWAEPVINLTQRRFEAGDLVFLAANSLVQFAGFSPDVEGIGISMDSELFALALGGNVPHTFDGHVRDFVMRLRYDQLACLDEMHQIIYRYLGFSDTNLPSTLHLICAFFRHVDHLWQRYEAIEQLSQSREQRLFADFLQLVAQHATTEHRIEYYASALCLSTRYMSALIKKVSGKPAKQWIDDAIIARIKVALRHSDKQIVQISDEMNFPNTSFFSKYFKRLTGMTPLEYRNSLQQIPHN